MSAATLFFINGTVMLVMGCPIVAIGFFAGSPLLRLSKEEN